MHNTTIDICIDDYVQIFNLLLGKYGLSQSEAARRAGLTQSTVSRFCAGRNMSISSFFLLIRSMPYEFQRDYWNELLGASFDSPLLSDLVATLDHQQLHFLLLAFAERYKTLTFQGARAS